MNAVIAFPGKLAKLKEILVQKKFPSTLNANKIIWKTSDIEIFKCYDFIMFECKNVNISKIM